MRRRGFTLIEFLMVITIIAVIAVLSIPGIISARKSANEGSAITSLRSISTQQAYFREKDPDGDDATDYASLTELSSFGLVDPHLGSGTKAGYRFEAAASTTTPDALWYAVGNPALPTRTGDRYFVTNQSGVIFFTYAGPQPVLNTTDCQPPVYMVPIK